MHVILRTAVCLVVLASTVAAHLIAERVEEVLPLSAPAQIHVTSGPGDESEALTLVSDFARNDLAAALVTFDATPDGVRRLLVLAPGFAERSAAPHALIRVDPAPAFGTRLASTETRGLETGVDTVYGQWTVFGSDPDVIAAAEALRAHGFTAEVKWAHLVVVEQVVTVAPPLLVVAVAVFLFATAAAAWVLTARSRLVRRVHGRSRGAVAAVDLVWTAAFVVAASTTSWLGWLLTATLAWGPDLTVGATGLVVARIIATSGSAAIGVIVLASLATHGASHPGARPGIRRRTVVVAAASAVSLAVIGATTLDARLTLEQADQGLRAAEAKRDTWRTSSSARLISLRYTTGSVEERESPAWSRFVVSQQAAGRLMLDTLDPGCNGLESAVAVDCVVVGDTFLRQVATRGGVDLSDDDDRVRVLIPRGLSSEAEAIRSATEDFVAFQREVETRFGCPDGGDCLRDLPLAKVVVQTYDSPLELPLLTAYPRTERVDDVLVDPVVTVVPEARRVLSVDYHLASLSSGDELYLGSHEQLTAALAEHGIRDLVFADTDVTSETGSIVPQWQAWKTQAVVTLWFSSLLAIGMVVLLVQSSVHGRARSLVVQRAHGLGPLRRHGGLSAAMALLAVAASLVPLAGLPGTATVEATALREVVDGLALATAFVVLAGPTALWFEGRLPPPHPTAGRPSRRHAKERDIDGTS